MERRICTTVISQMLEEIPATEKDFIKDLKWNLDDAAYKAPEENLQWIRTQQTLIKHIPTIKKNWEKKVLSIFSKMSIEEIEKTINPIK